MLRFKTQGNNLFLHNLSKKKNSVASSSMSRENMVEFNMPVFFFSVNIQFLVIYMAAGLPKNIFMRALFMVPSLQN